MSVPAGPIAGPCTAWVSGADVQACCAASGVPGGDTELFDTVAVLASMLLYELSGGQFSGLCDPVTVRPCRDSCSCFGQSPSLGLGNWYWAPGFGGLGGWGWWNECGSRCGCGFVPSVPLAGYPVREIVSVKIDGAEADPATYRLDRWRELVRLSDPGPPVVPRYWPVCQDLTLDDDQPGTWSITYRSGVAPPAPGLEAAKQLGCQLYLACTPGNDGQCKLPTGTTKVTKQGITVERGLLAQFLRPGQTGLVLVDAFLAAYNPEGLRRRPAVWSPDVTPYPLRMT